MYVMGRDWSCKGRIDWEINYRACQTVIDEREDIDLPCILLRLLRAMWCQMTNERLDLGCSD